VTGDARTMTTEPRANRTISTFDFGEPVAHRVREVLVPWPVTFARFTASQGRRCRRVAQEGTRPKDSTSEFEAEDAASGVTGRREMRPMLLARALAEGFGDRAPQPDERGLEARP
jgi:hypothetical protein